MKRIFLFFAMVMMSILTMAQAPQKMNFQALVRNSANELVTNQAISIEISVLNGSNVAVFTETQNVTTNANGVATLVIGEGTTTKGTFAGIDWSAGNYYLQTTATLGGGASAIVGTTPLMSVPYALYAEKAGNTYTKEEVDALLAEMNEKIAAIEENGGGSVSGKKGDVVIENGAIKAAFSVAEGKQVYFSMGNLQYKASTNTWRFAEHQYDMIGNDNKNISSSYSGYIDLFGWGTSGWAESGAKAYQPYSTSTSYSDYYVGGSYTHSLTGRYANADWGVYNKISNGGNTAGQWRTLTYEEWYYLTNTRTDASSLLGSATVNGVNGMIFLPDNWSTPEGVSFFPGFNGYDNNTYTTSEWSKMESNGAVFLPASGGRRGTDMNDVGSYGLYWSSSYCGGSRYSAYHLYFDSSSIIACISGRYDRNYGFSVRVVQDL